MKLYFSRSPFRFIYLSFHLMNTFNEKLKVTVTVMSAVVEN